MLWVPVQSVISDIIVLEILAPLASGTISLPSARSLPLLLCRPRFPPTVPELSPQCSQQTRLDLLVVHLFSGPLDPDVPRALEIAHIMNLNFFPWNFFLLSFSISIGGTVICPVTNVGIILDFSTNPSYAP